MREFDIRSRDGTRIRAWRTDSTGPDVLLCPGLGTMPEAWPALLAPGLGVRVHSWYHRGTMGSARPADQTRIGLADHLADALAVLDDAGLDQCVVMGWSAGTSVAAELAARCPDRVAGLLLVAGSAGDALGGVLGLLDLPQSARKAIVDGVTRLVRTAGPLFNVVLHNMPVNLVTATLVRHTGLMLPASPTADVVRAGRRFLQHDWGWYGRLAMALAAEPERDLTGLRCPVTLLVGRYDLLADPRHAARSLGPLPQARIRVLPTSHFLPFEAPDALAEELSMLTERADAVRAAQRWADAEEADEVAVGMALT